MAKTHGERVVDSFWDDIRDALGPFRALSRRVRRASKSLEERIAAAQDEKLYEALKDLKVLYDELAEQLDTKTKDGEERWPDLVEAQTAYDDLVAAHNNLHNIVSKKQ